MSSVNGKRTYSSPRREQGAAQTRRAVLSSAHRLFVERGYTATTIGAIATEAEVSRPTVFAVGSKPQLLKLVRDIAIAGDDLPVPVPDRAPVAEMRAAPDAERTLRLHAHNVAKIQERYVDIDEVLRRASHTDPELQELWDSSEQQRLEGAAVVIDDVLRKGNLRRGLDRERAVDRLWLLMAPDQWGRLRQRGWSLREYEHWLAETLVDQLLP